MKTEGREAYSGEELAIETRQWMIAVRAGDAQAFERLVHAVRGRAFLVARSLVGSRDDAMELCQETFLKVYKARKSYDPAQPFLPWFHRILRNTCYSFLRKRRRLAQHSLTGRGPGGEPDEAGEWDIVDPDADATAGAERDERARLFQEALSGLSARDREILALRHFEELSYREIAIALDVPEGTVMSRLFHARRRLREVLAPLLGEDAPSPSRARGGKEGTSDAR